MQKRRLFVLCGCVVCAIILASCSGSKDLPSGKRVAVLDSVQTLENNNGKMVHQIFVPSAVSNSEWLQNDMNVAHKSNNLKAGTEFQKQWAAGFGTGSSKRELLLSKPLAKNGLIYTLDADGILSAFNLKDGEKIWTLELEPANRRVNATALKGSGIAIYDNNIYVTTGFGAVVAVDLKKQTKIWEQNLRTPLRIAPVTADGKLFVQSVDNKFFALDMIDGHILWQHDIAMESTTLVGGAEAAYDKSSDMAVTGFSNGELQSFNATLGLPLWSDVLISNHRAYSSTFLHTIKASPVIENGIVYALGTADVFTAVDLRTGERLWEQPFGGTQTPLLISDTLYVVGDDKRLAAFDKKSGDVLWNIAIKTDDADKDARIYAPVMINNSIIVTMSDGHILAYNPHNGKLEKTVDLGENLNSAPIIVDDYVVFTTMKAKLLVFK